MGGEREEDKMRGENRKTTKKGTKGKEEEGKIKGKNVLLFYVVPTPVISIKPSFHKPKLAPDNMDVEDAYRLWPGMDMDQVLCTYSPSAYSLSGLRKNATRKLLKECIKTINP
jgi:hypothetical protein